MTRQNRRTSPLAVALVVVLAAGSAFLLRAQVVGADFSALDVLGVNHLATGRLDVSVGASTTSLSVKNLAPGDTAYGRLELENTGTLPLIYAVAASIDDAGLASSLVFSLWLDGDCTSPDEASLLIDGVPMSGVSDAPLLGDPSTGRQRGDRVIEVGASDALCYSVGLPLDASNASQGQTGVQTFTIFAEHHLPGATATTRVDQ